MTATGTPSRSNGSELDARAAAHELLDQMLDQVLAAGFFGVGTMEVGCQNGKLSKCEADVRRKLRPPK